LASRLTAESIASAKRVPAAERTVSKISALLAKYRAAADFLSERAHRHTLVSVSGEESRRGGAERVAEIVELILGEGGSRHGDMYTT
jgi:hypothetical protein